MTQKDAELYEAIGTEWVKVSSLPKVHGRWSRCWRLQNQNLIEIKTVTEDNFVVSYVRRVQK